MSRKEVEEKIRDIVSHLEATDPNDWCLDVVRKGNKNCLFGHIFAMGKDDKESNELWSWFENYVANTYIIYPINDGTNPDYKQPTAKERCIAYLNDVISGKRETMEEMWLNAEKE